MKLSEVKTYHPVQFALVGHNPAPHSHFHVLRPGMDTIEMTLQDGIVNIKLGEQRVLVGLSNIIYMVPAQEQAQKASEQAPKAAKSSKA